MEQQEKKELFFDSMEVIRLAMEKNDSDNNHLAEVFNSSYVFLENVYPLQDQLVQLLSVIMEDNNDWIRYFVYENDFGKNGLEVTENDGKTVVPMATVNDLWRFLSGRNKNDTRNKKATH